VADPAHHVGPKDALYDLVLGLVEARYDAQIHDRFAAWLRSVPPTVAHMAVMLVEVALRGTPMGSISLTLAGFRLNGEPIIEPLRA
jgi:hypothetical protein